MLRSRFLVVALTLGACATADPAGLDGGGGQDQPDARPIPDAAPFADAKPFPDAMPGAPDAAPQPTTCTEDTTIQCGAVAAHALFFADSSIGNYACQTVPNTTNRENVYKFTRTTAGMTTINLDVVDDNALFGDDFDLYLLHPMCATNNCVGTAETAGDDSLTFMAEANTPYFIVVEAFAIGVFTTLDYNLSITCP